MLFWRELETSEWRPLEPAPGTNSGFRETGRYRFRSEAVGGALAVDDEPLSQPPGALEWMWTPGFYAGEVTAQYTSIAGEKQIYLLDVSPDPMKLGRDVFAQMMGELWQEDPGLVLGSEPGQNPVGSAGTLYNPWLAFSRLRRYAPAFLQALAAVRVQPRRALRVSRRDVAPNAVRRIDRATVASLSRSATVALLADDGSDVDLAGCTFNVPITEETLDSAANRCLLALTRAVLQRTRALLAGLEQTVAREVASETRTALAVRWPARRRELEDIQTRLVAALRRQPFPQVSRADVTAAGLTAIAADPIYARAWGRGWRAIRDGVDTSTESERMWVSPSWEIYERWCFVALRRWLASSTSTWDWTRMEDGRRWTASGPDSRIELTLQPTFRAWSETRGERWSVSRQREPDIVLTVTKGDASRFVVFDAKYRASRQNVLEAMQSAHIYQDSLRFGIARPSGALLLVPAGGGAPWLERADFQDEHRVGIVQMAPGREPALPAFVRDLLSSSSAPVKGAGDVLG